MSISALNGRLYRGPMGPEPEPGPGPGGGGWLVVAISIVIVVGLWAAVTR